MRKEHLKFLICPDCKGELRFASIEAEHGDFIETGTLACGKCCQSFPILKFIPRFVPVENYASGFGLEWTKHARTQYDSYTGSKVSETRFFNETKWPRQMPGQIILEAGSGSGRFTELAAATGAMVISLDFSYAVEANYASNGKKPNVLIVQADIYKMPFRENAFDKLFCFGVLQHTPDPAKAFAALPAFLKPGGALVVDVYKRNDSLRGYLGKLVSTKYFVRPFTRRMEPEKLYDRCKTYVNFMWPIARVLNKIPKVGCWLNWRLMIADYRGIHNLSDEMLKEWAILDTFDMTSPRYDSPQTKETLENWFHTANLANVDVHFGYNGIEGRGVKK